MGPTARLSVRARPGWLRGLLITIVAVVGLCAVPGAGPAKASGAVALPVPDAGWSPPALLTDTVSMTLDWPVGGERVVRGSTQTVRWTMTSPVSAGGFRLYLQNSSGSYVQLTSSLVPAVAGQTSYSWTWAVTQSTVSKGLFSLRYYDATGALVTSVDHAVTVLSAQPTLAWPTGGERVVQGSTQTVRWTMPYAVSEGYFRIYLRNASGAYVQITSSALQPVTGQTSYSWTWDVTQPAVEGGALRLRYFNGAGATMATAEKTISVLSATPTLIWPAGGEAVTQGSTQTVSWTMPNPVSQGRFLISLRDAGGVFTQLTMTPVPAVAGQLSYSWTWYVTQPPVDGGVLRLRYLNDAGTVIATVDRSISVTATSPVPAPTVTSPNGGERLDQDDTVTVSWSLSVAAGTGSLRVEAVSPTEGSFTLGTVAAQSDKWSYSLDWTITQPVAADYRVRVSYLDTGGAVVASDESDAAFAVVQATPATGVRDLVVTGKYAYVAAGPDGLRIFDVADPDHPAQVGACDTPGEASGVSVCGRYAYVADGPAGLKVIDVLDPSHPSVVASLGTPGAARGLCFSAGRLLQDFDSTSGFTVSGGTIAADTTHVKHGTAALKLSVAAAKTAYVTRDGLGWDLSREQGALQLWVYVRSSGAPAGAYDKSSPLKVSLSNATTMTDYFATATNYYVHDGWNLLRFCTSDWKATGSPSWSRPFQRLRLLFTAPSDRAVELSFDELRAGERGLTPAFMWTFDDGYDEVYRDVLPYLSPLRQRGTVYVTSGHVDKGGLNISLAHLQALYAGGWALGNHTSDHTDLSAVDQATAASRIAACTSWLLAHGFPRAAYHMAYPYNNSSAGARAAALQCGILSARRHGFRNQYVPVDDALMLNSFGVEDATATIDAWRTKIDRAIDTGGTLIFYGHYFTADNLPLFKQIADYVAQRRLWAPPINEWWDTLAMQGQAGDVAGGTYLYVACGDAGLQVVDVADPLHPALVGTCDTAGAAAGAAPCDRGACLTAGSGIELVDAQRPATPQVIGGLSGTDTTKGVCVRGTTAYVAAGEAGLRIVSIADPAHPVLLGALDTPGDAVDVTVVGDTAYVADGSAGVEVVDVGDRAHPQLTLTRALPSPASAIVAFGGRAYVVDGIGGLRVVAVGS